MYSVILTPHSWLRWLVIGLALLTSLLSIAGLIGKKPWTPAKNRLTRIWLITIDIQFTLGLVLYIFLSPVTKAAFSNFGAAMKDSSLRFYAIEHITMMILAVALAHIGKVLVGKAPTDAAKHRRAALCFTCSFLLMVAGIRW